jgi:hypothetical protein
LYTSKVWDMFVLLNGIILSLPQFVIRNGHADSTGRRALKVVQFDVGGSRLLRLDVCYCHFFSHLFTPHIVFRATILDLQSLRCSFKLAYTYPQILAREPLNTHSYNYSRNYHTSRPPAIPNPIQPSNYTSNSQLLTANSRNTVSRPYTQN